MAIEWDETVETKRRVRMLVDRRGSPSAPAAAVWAPGFRDATIDDLRRACEAAGLVVETRERATADLEDRANLREAYQKLTDEQDACLDALAEHVSPDGTADTPRMVRPTSVLAGIRSLQGRLRDARSDLRDHDAALDAAEARHAVAVTGLRQQLAEVVAQRDDLRARLDRAEAATAEALAILNAMPGDDIVSAARHMMDVRMRQSVGREALRYRLATIVNEAFGAQPVTTHEELLSFLESRLRERTRNLAAARARAEKAESRISKAEATSGVSLESVASAYAFACKKLGINPDSDNLGRGVVHATRERDDLRARLETAEARLATETARAEKAEAQAAQYARDWYDAKSEFVTASGKLMERIRSLEAYLTAAKEREATMLAASAESVRLLTADLAAARARIAELEAPMPEATVEEIRSVFMAAEAAHLAGVNRLDYQGADMAGAIAVAERVRRERPPCLIARAVAANIDVRVAEDVGGGFLVGIHRPEKDEHMVRNVPAAEVPAELARMLTEVGA